VPGFETGVPRNSRPPPVTNTGGHHRNNIKASPIRTRQVQQIRSTRNDEDYGGSRSPARFDMDGRGGIPIKGVFANPDDENENAANFVMNENARNFGRTPSKSNVPSRYQNDYHEEYGNNDDQANLALSSSHVRRIQSMSKPWSVPDHLNKPFTPNSVRQPPQSANANDNQGRGGNQRYPDQPLVPPAKAMWDSPRGNEFEVRTTNDGGFVMAQDASDHGGGYKDYRNGDRMSNNNQNSPIWLSEDSNFQVDVRGGYDDGAENSNSNFTVGSKGLLRAKQRRPSRNKSSHQQTPENGDEYDFGQNNVDSYVVGGARGVASLRRHRS